MFRSIITKKYFLDKGNLVSQKDNSDKKEIRVKNVCSFLIKEDELVYILFDEKDKVYIKISKTIRTKMYQ
jgi:hypothetical protein